MDFMVIFWMVAAGVFLVLELVTAAMCSIWFVAGTLVSLIAALCGAPLWLQILLFFVVSGLCFVFLYPRLKKYLNTKKQPTNADMTLGQVCTVTRTINNLAGEGAVITGGKTWTARSLTDEIIEEGRLVRAIRIEGVKLMVVPLPVDERAILDKAEAL